MSTSHLDSGIGNHLTRGSLLLALLLGQLFLCSSADARRKRGQARPAALGALEISTMTDGAAVMVDNKAVGTLPLKDLVKLKPGKHTIKVSKRGYTEYLDVFTITSGETTTLDIDLLPFAGIFTITCNEPDARVFVDGKYVGIAPLEREVLIGDRKVRVRKPGFYDYLQTHNAIAGEFKQIVVELKAMAVGSTPYRPPPPPPPKWYEKWYVWVGAAGGVAAITAAIVIPVLLTSGDPIEDFNADFSYKQ